MPVTVEPADFTFVEFDSATIADLASRLAAEVGLPTDTQILVRVDETTALGHSKLVSIDPIVIEAESGAFEDPKVLKRFLPEAAADVIGRLLLRARDRMDPAFADAPAEDQLTLQQYSSWEIYAVGRLARLGHEVQRQRRLYQFRTRHGFTDVADRSFEELWGRADLGWADIERLSREAAEANPGRLSA